MKETNGQIRFDISTLLKTSKPGKHQEPLKLKPYTYDSQLCVVKSLQQYIKQTSEVRNTPISRTAILDRGPHQNEAERAS